MDRATAELRDTVVVRMVRLLEFTGERIVPGAANCEPSFARKMYQEHILRYEFVAEFVQDRDILDVGCGVGYGSQHLAKRGAKSVLGIDISDAAIRHAKSEFGHEKVAFESFAAQKFASEVVFDIVTCFEMIEHVTEQAAVLDMIKRCLRPEGMLAISTPRPYSEMRSDYHEKELDLDSFLSLLKARFRHVAVYSERNCFASLICDEPPIALDRILTIADCFAINQSDYFIALATDGDPSQIVGKSPVIVLNDDDYVRTLEKDVGILRSSELNSKQRILDLEAEQQSWLQQIDGVSDAHASRPDLLAKLADSAAALATAQTDATSRLAEIETLRLLHASALATANAAQEALAERGRAVSELRHRAEQAEALHAHELGEAQKLHVVLQQHSTALAAALERADHAEAYHAHELNEARRLHAALQEHSVALDASLRHAGQIEAALRDEKAALLDEREKGSQRVSDMDEKRRKEAAGAAVREAALTTEIAQLRDKLDEAKAELDLLRDPWHGLAHRFGWKKRNVTKAGDSA